MSLSAAARASATEYAGPGNSFPLYTSGDHLRAAWDLAGHAKDPGAVRRKVRAFAAKHGLSSLLPTTARKAEGVTEDDDDAPQVPRVRQMIHLAYETAENNGDGYGQERTIRFAQDHNLAHHLPDRAHGFMHARGIPHLHDGEENPTHGHLVTKAVQVVIKPSIIGKAWALDDGTCVIEGWVSTPDEDGERDIVPPEAFSDALDGYAERRMPLSSEHAMKALPIGHGQHVALVRDGKVFAEAKHPTDAAEFEHFPGTGTGVYGRYLITDPQHADAVRKGNIGGFSWVGNLRSYEPRPGGGRKYVRIDPWLESTVAAYPVNRKALVLAAKAYEAELAPVESADADKELTVTLEELLAGAAAAKQAEDAAAAQAEQAVTKADLAALVAALNTKVAELETALAAKVDDAVAKAMPADRNGVGRVGTVAPAESDREADPLAYIIRKATEAFSAGDELGVEDKQLAWGIFDAALRQGMSGE